MSRKKQQSGNKNIAKSLSRKRQKSALRLTSYRVPVYYACEASALVAGNIGVDKGSAEGVAAGDRARLQHRSYLIILSGNHQCRAASKKCMASKLFGSMWRGGRGRRVMCARCALLQRRAVAHRSMYHLCHRMVVGMVRRAPSKMACCSRYKSTHENFCWRLRRGVTQASSCAARKFSATMIFLLVKAAVNVGVRA